MNADKSRQPSVGGHYIGSYPTINELLTIEREHGTYRFIFVDHDRTLNFVTDMKGGDVEIKSADDASRFSWIRVRRTDSSGYTEDTAISHQECSVSVDGKSLTVKRQIFVDNEFPRTFVYDRIR